MLSRLSSARSLWLAGAWTIAVLEIHAAAAYRGDGVLWGADAYAFFPRAFLWCALAVASTASAFAFADSRLAERSWIRFAGTVPRFPWFVALCAGAIFWLLRDATLLIGDGLPLVARLIQPARPAVLEPGAMAIFERSHAALRSPLLAAGLTEFGAAWSSAALVSVVAGALFVWCVLRISRRLCAREAHGSSAVLAGLLALTLCTQGYVQIFMGHAESYGLVALLFALYLLAAIEALAGDWPFWPAGLVLGAALITHLMSAVLLPSFAWAAVLLWNKSADARQQWSVVLVVAGAAALALAGYALLLAGSSHARLAGVLQPIVVQLIGDSARLPFRPGDLARRALQFFNGQMLAGPWSALGLLVAGASLFRSRRPITPATSFLLVAGISATLAAALAGESNLGYARNWDLLAPLAFVAAAGACGALLQAIEVDRAQRAVAAIVIASVFHSAPWFAINSSESLSLARFATLPLGGSAAESSIGFWHALMGRPEVAKEWLLRSERKDPSNIRARLTLGKLYFEAGNYRASYDRYAAAEQLRPDLVAPVPGLTAALLASNRDEAARAAVSERLRQRPANAGIWASAAALGRLDGNRHVANSLADSALSRDPTNPALLTFRQSLADTSAKAEARILILRLLRLLAES